MDYHRGVDSVSFDFTGAALIKRRREDGEINALVAGGEFEPTGECRPGAVARCQDASAALVAIGVTLANRKPALGQRPTQAMLVDER